MNFRMPKEISGIFKKKKDSNQGEPEYRNEDFGLEDDWEVEDPFVKEKNDKIVMEDVNPQKNSRRLKGKLIFGIAGALALFLAWSVLSNMMAPKQPVQKEESANLSTGSKMTNPAATVPNNYADMAKYQRELEQRKAAEEALKKRSMTNQAVPNTNNVQAPPAPAAPPSLRRAAMCSNRLRRWCSRIRGITAPSLLNWKAAVSRKRQARPVRIRRQYSRRWT